MSKPSPYVCGTAPRRGDLVRHLNGAIGLVTHATEKYAVVLAGDGSEVTDAPGAFVPFRANASPASPIANFADAMTGALLEPLAAADAAATAAVAAAHRAPPDWFPRGIVLDFEPH